MTAMKISSTEFFQEAPKLSMKDLILLYKNSQTGIDLPKRLQDKYFMKKKDASKLNIDDSMISNSDRFISLKHDF